MNIDTNNNFKLNKIKIIRLIESGKEHKKKIIIIQSSTFMKFRNMMRWINFNNSIGLLVVS